MQAPTVTLEYLSEQALKNPHIKRIGFLAPKDVEILTGRDTATIARDERKGYIKRCNPKGQPRYDISAVHAYLTVIGYLPHPSQ